MSAMAYREPNEVLWRGVRPGHRGVQVPKYNSASNGTTIVHTVTAAKVFFLTFWSFSARASAVGGTAEFFIRDDEDAAWFRIQFLGFDAVGQGLDSGMFSPPLEIPAGYDIVVKSSLITCDVYGAIDGWEE